MANPKKEHKTISNLFKSYERKGFYNLTIKTNSHKVNYPTIDLMGIEAGDITATIKVLETLHNY